MTKTAKKRQKVVMPGSIRKKLSAALCMLLVSTIMMVSTTYAWFTLSTAPEVTGITTNVGSNGNLEIALLNKDSYKSSAEDLGIISNVGDSMTVKSATEANETWGNLVDLSSSLYGLSNIVLSPAALNIAQDGKTINPTILLAPRYGSDGRVIAVDANTLTGGYKTSNFIYGEEFAGVRAIGTSTQVSARVAAYRNALAGITTNMNAAKSEAVSSLVNNGQTLANIMVGQVQSEGAKVTSKQKTALDSMVASLQTANNKAGDAIKQAILAYSLSAVNTDELTDEQVSALVSAVTAATVSDVGSVDGVLMPNEANDIISKWNAINVNLKTAKDKLGEAVPDADSNYEYSDISPALDALVNKKKATIANVTNPKRDDLGKIMDYYTRYNKIDIVMANGSGVYADLAELVGNYSASGLTVDVTYMGAKLPIPVSMNTNVDPSALIGTISTGGAPAAGEVTNAILSDTYGYAIDFGFRTNAAGSDLQLQTAAAQRVYSDSESKVTQGSGSYMEFHTANVNTFSVDELRALMSAIRVVFASPSDSGYDVLGIGALDITTVKDAAGNITAYTGGKVVNANGEEAENGDGLKADLVLYDYNINQTTNEVELEAKKTEATPTLTALAQNVAKKVTVIVYLDGDIVDNTMVANANTSTTNGKLNLQFSSSADLTAMENSALRYAGDGSAVEYTLKASAGDSYTFGGQTFTVKENFEIYQGSNGKVYYKGTGSEQYVELMVGNAATVLTIASTGD